MIYHLAVALLALVGCARTGAPDPTASEQEAEAMGQSFSNPYQLAEAALAAARSADADAWSSLLPAPGVGSADPSVVSWTDADRVIGLYFQEDGTRAIAAVVRAANGEEPAVWFRIRRSAGGFVLDGLMRTPADPEMTISVEG